MTATVEIMMTSCNLYTKQLFSNGGDAPSETTSEISSIDSLMDNDWNDLRTIAAQLGISNIAELSTERFKVDRQKLNNMIASDTNSNGGNTAEDFFNKVMQETTTYISWPCRLKVGAKTKKDPHVRIVGKLDDVSKAKERIMSCLDSRGSRVIMKMDVSYTDHSYIIGRGGNNIKSIMDDTKTHIHFPDSNRTNPVEKSNQVSLCGSIDGVERARALVRASTPVLISFELPILAAGHPVPDANTTYVKEVQAQFEVQVIFSTKPKLHSSLVLVKGSEDSVVNVKRATQLLINQMCEGVANQIMVQMLLEISPQHHVIVKGKDNINLIKIMETTRTRILFQDINDMNVKPIKRSQVTITGDIEGVYLARQLLIGNLPITLMFDHPNSSVDPAEIVALNRSLDVCITVRPKQRQSTLCIMIRGVEKFIDNIYEARHKILNLSETTVKAVIPKTYFFGDDESCAQNLYALLAHHPEMNHSPSFFFNSPINFETPGNWSADSGTLNGREDRHSILPIDTTPRSHNHQTKLISASSSSSSTSLNASGFGFGTGMATGSSSTSLNSASNVAVTGCASLTVSPCASANSSASGSIHLQVPMHVSPRSNSSRNTSGYQSYCSSNNSLEQSFQQLSTNGVHQQQQQQQPLQQQQQQQQQPPPPPPPGLSISPSSSTNMTNNLPESPNYFTNRHHTVGFGRMATFMNDCSPNYDLKKPFDHNHEYNFDMKKVEGLRAMEVQPRPGEVRTPNSNWAGLGLSKTSPNPLESSEPLSWDSPDSPFGLNTTTSLLDSTPIQCRITLNKHSDIHSLFTSLGLEHYIKTFVVNEIDLNMFATLTEQDLISLGITAFGARKKLRVAISALAAHQPLNNSPMLAKFSGSAAPGAERRTSTNSKLGHSVAMLTRILTKYDLTFD